MGLLFVFFVFFITSCGWFSSEPVSHLDTEIEENMPGDVYYEDGDNHFEESEMPIRDVIEDGTEIDSENTAVEADSFDGDLEEEVQECQRNEDCDDGNVCTDDFCDISHRCVHVYNTSPCDDGFFCTLVDRCDGRGNCAGSSNPCDDSIGCTENQCLEESDECIYSPDDSLCPASAVCMPECSAESSGCVEIPATFDLKCTTPSNVSTPSICTLNLEVVTGQSSCISCTSKVGQVLLDYSDFGDDVGRCDDDGWLLDDTSCSSSVLSCTPSGSIMCCLDFGRICRSLNGNYLLRVDYGLTCFPSRMEEWRLYKTFNTTGITNLELCFKIGDRGADSNEGLFVYVSDGLRNEQVFCLNGEPQPGIDDFLYPYCISLPSWASNNTSLKITFIAHSDNSGDILYLDDISLRGWLASCPPTVQTVFREDFTGCPSSIPDGWNGWRVVGNPQCATPVCPSSSEGVFSWSDSWSMERTIDTSLLSGNVILCFDSGDFLSDLDSRVSVEFDTGKGSGWQTAWLQTGDLGPDRECRTNCVNLSNINNDVNGNPNLKIRFSVSSLSGGNIVIDNIVVSGSVYCDATGIVSISSLSETTPATYMFNVTDVSGTPLDAFIECSWGTSSNQLKDNSTIRFIR